MVGGDHHSALLGETIERINQFKKWFWSVLEKFTAVERQDLVRVQRCLAPIIARLDLFLDGQSGVTCFGGRLPTSAIGDDPTGR